MTAPIRLAAVNGDTIDPLIAAHSPRATADRLRDSRKIIARHNGDNARLEALMRSQPGPTARQFLNTLSRMQPLVATDEPRHVIVHPSIAPTDYATPQLSQLPPLYDQAIHPDSRVPEALALPLSLLVRNVEKPGSVNADALLHAVAAVRAFITAPPVVGEGNDPHGMPRPDAFDRATGSTPDGAA